MLYNVAGLLKSHTGASRTVLLEAWPALGEPDLVLLAPLRGRLTLTRDHAGVLVRGRLESRIQTPCVRCLAPAELAVVLELEEAFRPTVILPGGPPVGENFDHDSATEIDALHHLDLSEVLRQAVLLSVPQRPMCRPDCRGLCAHCGQNRNEVACPCSREPDLRWQALKTMLDEAEMGRPDLDTRRAKRR